ncbi:unnamed protein product [Didymodactylos carnosus]|uniref:Uncharacterized protein n=1 Tax=Didymodactylos carnosus TaxID=1234261 RepID=A0A815WV44_9BILA
MSTPSSSRSYCKPQYTSENVKDAVAAYKSGSMTSVQAAKTFKVPESTIRNHARNSQLKIGVDRKTLLSEEEEQYFVSLIKYAQYYGTKFTKSIVRKYAAHYLKLLGYVQRVTNNSDNKKVHNITMYVPGKKWLCNFLNRWKNELKCMSEKKLEKNRKTGFTEEVRVGWFNLLHDIMSKNQLFDKSIETVIVPRGERHVYEDNGGTGKSFTTCLMCISASGDMLPPYIVYAAKNLCSSCFIAQTQHLPRPLLLVLDGLGAHVNVTCIELAIVNNIILLVLPPHTTHGLQPLDLVILGVVKSYWYKVMSSYKKQGYNAIRKPDFLGLINHVYEQICTKRQVVSSFARSGIWPFDNQAMKDKVAVGKRQKPVSLNVTTLSTCQDDVSTSSFSTMSTDTYQTMKPLNVQIPPYSHSCVLPYIQNPQGFSVPWSSQCIHLYSSLIFVISHDRLNSF